MCISLGETQKIQIPIILGSGKGLVYISLLRATGTLVIATAIVLELSQIMIPVSSYSPQIVKIKKVLKK